jgi:hypothetical protein
MKNLDRIAGLQDVQLYSIPIEQDFAFSRHVEGYRGRTNSNLNRAIHEIDIRKRARTGAKQAVDRASVHVRRLSIESDTQLSLSTTRGLVLTLRRGRVLSVLLTPFIKQNSCQRACLLD